jgi:hypothetical protein
MDDYSDLLLSGSSSIFGSAASEESLGDIEASAVPGGPTMSGLGGLGGPPMAVASDELPAQTTPANASLGAAISFFTVAAGAAVGYKIKRWKGALGGALLGGGVRNLWRARTAIQASGLAQKGEGIQQGMIGLAGVAAGIYLLISKE